MRNRTRILAARLAACSLSAAMVFTALPPTAVTSYASALEVDLDVEASKEIIGKVGVTVENGEVCHTLIISPPCCGKTTLLRDVIRQISNGNAWCEGKNVGVVDERSEIGGAYQGVPQNDLGIRTDLLDCCPKAEGMMMLIRSMSPEVVAVDEIGDYGDIKAIESVLNCGCRLIATVHGSSVEDIEKKPLLQKMVKEHVFDRYIILSGKKKIGSVWGIFDGRGTRLYGEEGVVC